MIQGEYYHENPGSERESISEGADGGVGETDDERVSSIGDCHLHAAEEFVRGEVDGDSLSIYICPPAGEIISLDFGDGFGGRDVNFVVLKVGNFFESFKICNSGDKIDIIAFGVGRGSGRPNGKVIKNAGGDLQRP